MDMLFIKGMMMKERVKDFFKKESGEVNVVAIIVLIAVAIAIALVFKEEIGKLVENLFTKLGTQGDNAMDKIGGKK